MSDVSPEIRRNRKIGCAAILAIALLFIIALIVIDLERNSSSDSAFTTAGVETMARPALPAYAPVALDEGIATKPPAPRECPQQDPAICQAGIAQFQKQWPLAWKGDYQSQRNIAHDLADGGSYRIFDARRPVRACAWRAIIIASGSDKVDDTDLANFNLYCGRLDDTDKQRAERIADIMSEKIYGRPLGLLPLLQARRPG